MSSLREEVEQLGQEFGSAEGTDIIRLSDVLKIFDKYEITPLHEIKPRGRPMCDAVREKWDSTREQRCTLAIVEAIDENTAAIMALTKAVRAKS